MAFNYDIAGEVSSLVVKRGRKAAVTVKITNADKQIAYCEGELKKYNGRRRLNSEGNNAYSLSAVIPIIAPKGTYEAEIYAVSTEGEKGPVFKAKIQIV